MQSVPKHYRWAAIGTLIFMAGGAGNAAWHIIFGVEKDLEALLSPTHLLLAIGATLMVSGPFRAALHRPSAELPMGGSVTLQVLLSLTLPSRSLPS
jgi:hypothetical protein